MSAKFKKTATVLVLTAGDLQRALRVCRTTSYEILHRAGAVRVGERALRLSVDRLAAALGKEMAALIVRRISASKAA